MWSLLAVSRSEWVLVGQSLPETEEKKWHMTIVVMIEETCITLNSSFSLIYFSEITNIFYINKFFKNSIKIYYWKKKS